ncbi:hypothetical protein ACGFZP_16235 [Kitasatospora sp. NPDC048239]|uniref:hypothetical protein n=1 Tax=Kitasatospora sp. NPDC048239 TaxID=3364046 RepID=UPI003713A8C9
MTTAEQTGRRVQEALDSLAGRGQSAVAEDLVRELMAFYGEGLARIVALLPEHALSAVLDDPAAAGLLVLHDLHPEPVAARIERALASLPEHPVRVLGFDPEDGTLRLARSASGGCGCAGTEEAAREAIEGALACHAPEVTMVELARAPQLLQIGTRPPAPAEAR